mmetsp:Transcript_2910/g.4892  ORF Transcript_2910/g.4892 Transcript_2910/m.4892 type:complete len:205 (+) Transcript_2910:381-995(+)
MPAASGQLLLECGVPWRGAKHHAHTRRAEGEGGGDGSIRVQQPLSGNAGTLHERGHLAPGNVSSNRHVLRRAGKPAVSARHNPCGSKDVHKPQDALRHQFRVLHCCAAGGNHTGHQHLVKGKVLWAQVSPLVLVACVCCLDEDILRLHLAQHRPDVLTAQVPVMRPGVVPPAHVHAHRALVHVLQRVVHRGHVQRQDSSLELGV